MPPRITNDNYRLQRRGLKPKPDKPERAKNPAPRPRPEPLRVWPTTPRDWQVWFHKQYLANSNMKPGVAAYVAMMDSYPDPRAREIRQLPEHGDIIIENPYRLPDEPLYWGIRLAEDTIKPEHRAAIYQAFAEMEQVPDLTWEGGSASRVEGRKENEKEREERMRKEAAMSPEERLRSLRLNRLLHLMSWDRRGNGSRVSASTCQKDGKGGAKEGAQKAVIKFLAMVDKALSGRPRRLLQKQDPEAARAAAAVASDHDYELYEFREDWAEEARERYGGVALRGGLMGTTMAVGRGSSPKYHLDRQDFNSRTYSLVFCVSERAEGWDEEGERTGDLVLRPLGLRVPIRPGQIFLFRSQLLVHNSMDDMDDETREKRVFVTMFTDEKTGEAVEREWVGGAVPQPPKYPQ